MILEKEHSLFSPSSMYRWEKCVGSLGGQTKETSGNEASEFGTIVHSVLEHEFYKWKQTNYNKQKIKKVRTPALGSDFDSIFLETIITWAKKYEVMASYVDIVERIYTHIRYFFSSIFDIIHGSLKPALMYDFEIRVDISKYLPDHFGTLDALVVDKVKKTAHIIDLKTGHGAYFNGNLDKHKLQMLSYIVGVADLLESQNIEVDSYKMVLVYSEIKQTLTYEISLEDISNFKDRIKNIALKLLDENSEKYVIGDHCQYCNSMSECAVLKKRIQEITQFSKKTEFTIEDYEKLFVSEPIISAVLKKAERALTEQYIFSKDKKPKYLEVAIKSGREMVKPEKLDELKRHPKVKEFISTFNINKMRPILKDSEFEKFVTRSPSSEYLKPLSQERLDESVYEF